MNKASTSSAHHQALFRATVAEAAAAGAVLMKKMVSVAGKGLYARELAARTVYERDALIAAGKLLQSKEPELCRLYPQALLAAFTQPEQGKKLLPLTLNDVSFDQLELMDEGQVQSSVAIARAQQAVVLAVDASLKELNTLVCATLGLQSVRPESNPLRPEVYVNALKHVVDQVDVSSDIRLEWLTSMSVTLGMELHVQYHSLIEKLRAQGVVAVGYTVVSAPLGVGVGVPGSVSMDSLVQGPSARLGSSSGVGFDSAGYGLSAAQAESAIVSSAPESAQLARRAPVVPVHGSEDETLLTLGQLRRLLSGELPQPVPNSRIESFARQFAHQFEGEGSVDKEESIATMPAEFDTTVPAAFEALEDMKQVGQVVQRLQQRRTGGVQEPDAASSSVQAIRDMLRQSATGAAQALSLEVVTLMIDNIAQNPRLLEPIRQLIADLEPALLLLSLADPRFFSDKQHPARELLQEVTHRSMAYESTESPGFGGFLKELQMALKPLASAPIEDAEPFAEVLQGLRAIWQQAAQKREHERQYAVQVLQHAEQRNLLADKIAREIDTHPDAARVPAVVVDFLCGPWAQVVAQARISGGAGSKAAEKYQALISAMLWSAHPDLARKNVTKLTRLVPLLLATLRDGLETIRYPATKTSVFLEALMGVHQLAFRAAAKMAKLQASKADVGGVEADEGEAAAPEAQPSPQRLQRQGLMVEGEPWVAPEEALASNFMDFSASPPAPQGPAQPESASPPLPGGVLGGVADVARFEVDLNTTLDELPLGSWIELLANGQWVRTQLTWASPHGTLFLFTSVHGSSQSMTRRSREKMVAAGSLRLVSGQPVVDGALNAVAQIAMRNSLDSVL